MLLDSQGDRDAAENYYRLDELLDGRLDKTLNSFVRKKYLRALEVALTLEPGPGRQAMLLALSAGVSSQVRNHELLDANEQLTELLRRDKPELAELDALSHKVQAYLGIIHKKFDQAWDADKKSGHDMGKTAFAWFEHEMICFTDAIRATLRETLRKVPPAATAPAAKGD